MVPLLDARPLRVSRWGLPLFFKQGFQADVVEREVRDKPLELAVFGLEFLQAFCLVDKRAAKLLAPLVDYRDARAVHAREVLDLGSGFGLLEDSNNLGFAESTLAYGFVLLGGFTLRFYFWVDSNPGIGSMTFFAHDSLGRQS